MPSDPVYIAYNFNVTPLQPATEILIAELNEVGFESFIETETGLNAYIQKSNWQTDLLGHIQIIKSKTVDISYAVEEIEQTSWNAEWESNFKPITVDNRCFIRAPFHPASDFEFDIIIEPKMSFGTGHHETTQMMLQHLLDMDLKDKRVLDMGCGTGILAILAELHRAAHIDAIDIDHWCYLNCLENIERNNCKHISVYEGDPKLLKGKRYDLIVANINTTILIKDIGTYASCLNKKGTLILSGFYKNDIPHIEAECRVNMLKMTKKRVQNHWISLKFIN